MLSRVRKLQVLYVTCSFSCCRCMLVFRTERRKNFYPLLPFVRRRNPSPYTACAFPSRQSRRVVLNTRLYRTEELVSRRPGEVGDDSVYDILFSHVNEHVFDARFKFLNGYWYLNRYSTRKYYRSTIFNFIYISSLQNQHVEHRQ